MAVEKDRLGLAGMALVLLMVLDCSADVPATETGTTIPVPAEAVPADRARERRRTAVVARPASMVELWPQR